MRSTSRRRFLTLAAGGVLASTVQRSAPPPPASTATEPLWRPAPPASARGPNIVLILADDLGWGELGCYGQRMIKTPNLDRLASEGLRFTSAYAGSPVCAPSRASLLTGFHTGHSTVRENPQGAPQRSLTGADLTFGGLLSGAGYRTACVGKWGFGPERPAQASHPHARGFQEFYGYIDHLHAHQYWPRYLWHNQAKVPVRDYAPDLLVRRATHFIRESAGGPFCLFFSTILPHAPSRVRTEGHYRNKPWSRENRGHAAQVTLLDAHVRRILDALEKAGVADDTVLIFAGDNGPHQGKGVTPGLFDASGPFKGSKGSMQEGGIRVPMIASGRGVPRGEVTAEPVAFWDILPTFADVAGARIPDGLDGRSIRDVLTGKKDIHVHDHLIWNRPGFGQAVRRGRWKLIRLEPGIGGAGPRGRRKLFDLDADPGERHDLAATELGLVTELSALLDRSVD